MRLAACAAYLDNKEVVADVGCDHGKLTVFLARQGFEVIGIDINEKPLQKAKDACIRAKCLEKVSLRLGDGLQVLAPLEAKQIVIAGVSAETILHILDNASWTRTEGVRLVLCPATKLWRLRKGLCQRGFCIVDETPVVVASRCYSVVCAEYKGQPIHETEEFYLVGKIHGKPFAEELRKDTINKLKKTLLGLHGLEKEQQQKRMDWLASVDLGNERKEVSKEKVE